MERVLVSIGSNLFDPLYQVKQSLYAFSNYLPYIKFIAHSSFYCSRPLGGIIQPNFLNVVVIIDTILSPIELLEYIQFVELKQGRIRNCQRWMSRTLDIDILLFGNRIISIPRLIVPHYDMFNREFVLYPLFELMPNFCFFNGKMLSEYLYKLPRNGLRFWNVNDT